MAKNELSVVGQVKGFLAQDSVKNRFKEVLGQKANEKGRHVFFDYSPHIDSGEVTISVHKNGWKKDADPDKRFMVTISGDVGYKESSFAEVEAYLKELIA